MNILRLSKPKNENLKIMSLKTKFTGSYKKTLYFFCGIINSKFYYG